MPTDYNKLFQRLEPPAPRPELLSIVLARISVEHRRAVMARAPAFAAMFFSAMAGLFFSIRLLWLEIYKTGFVPLSSLAFSDFSLVMVNWQDYVFSLLENLPAISIAAVLIASLVGLIAIRGLAANLSTLFHRSALRSQFN